MNKREVVWLIVRLIGLYFAYMAVVSVFNVVGAGSAMYSASGTTTVAKQETESAKAPVGMLTPIPIPGMTPVRTESEAQPVNRLDPATEKQKSEAFRNLLFYLMLTAIYGAVGVYALKNGRILFDILNNEKSVSRKESDPAVTTLDL